MHSRDVYFDLYRVNFGEFEQKILDAKSFFSCVNKLKCASVISTSLELTKRAVSAILIRYRSHNYDIHYYVYGTNVME